MIELYQQLGGFPLIVTILVADIERWRYLVFRFLSNFTNAFDAFLRRILLVGQESLLQRCNHTDCNRSLFNEMYLKCPI